MSLMGARGRVMKYDYWHRDYYLYSDSLRLWVKVDCHLISGMGNREECASSKTYPRGTKFTYNFEAFGDKADAMLQRLDAYHYKGRVL